MTDVHADGVLEEMVRRLVREFAPRRIYLFGSKARGDDNPDSDYDLLVVVEHSNLAGYKRDQRAFLALRGVGASKDVIVLTREEFERRLPALASLPATVVREGNLVYEA